MVIDKIGTFESNYYQTWTEERKRAIERHVPLKDFHNKKVLEVGCGLSGIGEYYSSVGANVCAVDGREKYVETIRHRSPAVNCIHLNVEKEWPFRAREFDITIHFGLLYHLTNPIDHLRQVLDTTDVIFLETECVDLHEPVLLYVQENPEVFDASLKGHGLRPSPSLVELLLREKGFKYQNLEIDTFCSTDGQPYRNVYQWDVLGSGKSGQMFRRTWMARRG